MALSIAAIVLIILGTVDVLSGLASIFTHRVYLMGNTDQYTEESLARFSLPLGLSNMLCGTGLILCELLNTELFRLGRAPVSAGMIVLPALLLAGLAAYMIGRRVLVQKAEEAC